MVEESKIDRTFLCTAENLLLHPGHAFEFDMHRNCSSWQLAKGRPVAFQDFWKPVRFGWQNVLRRSWGYALRAGDVTARLFIRWL